MLSSEAAGILLARSKKLTSAAAGSLLVQQKEAYLCSNRKITGALAAEHLPARQPEITSAQQRSRLKLTRRRPTSAAAVSLPELQHEDYKRSSMKLTRAAPGHSAYDSKPPAMNNVLIL